MMTTEDQDIASESRPFTNPWPALMLGLAATAGAWVLWKVVPDEPGWGRFSLLAIALLAAGGGVAIRPRSTAVLFVAAIVSLLASFVGPESEWDSARLVMRVLFAVGVAAGITMLCPSHVRRVIFSFILLFHFGGILTAVSSPSGPWLSGQLWVHVYRPYLQFMYLNNAYAFYSPDPGPAPLLWFCIEYEKDADTGARNLRWVKMPYTDRDGKNLQPEDAKFLPYVEYTRRLSLGESANFPARTVPLTIQYLAEARAREGMLRSVPMDPNRPWVDQYRQPNEVSQKWVESYVRHVAHAYPHQTKPHLQVTGIKVYRVIHNIINPNQLEQGLNPDDPTLYDPFFMGEFDKDGVMKNRTWERDLNGNWGYASHDPFLNWLIPIMRQPVADDQNQPFHIRKKYPETTKVKNYVLVHAGDPEGEP
jgi:hypothetical protein